MSPSAASEKSCGCTTKLWVPVLVTVTVTLACTSPGVVVGVMVAALTSSLRSPNRTDLSGWRLGNWTDTPGPAAAEDTCSAGRPAGWPARVGPGSQDPRTATR